MTETTAIQKTEPRELAYTREQVDLIKQTVAKGATDLELRLFLHQAQRTGLDPFSGQIFCVKRHNNRTERDEMTIQTGIDGYRLVADRTGVYAGNDDYEFDDPAKQPKWAKAPVYKMVAGVRCPFSAAARWDQYYPGDGKQGFMWRRMPHLMLGKCAEALALRKAFPADLSGVYIAEELNQADGAAPSALPPKRTNDSQQEPKTRGQRATAELPEPLARLKRLLENLHEIDPAFNEPAILAKYFHLKDGKLQPITLPELLRLKTPKALAWVERECDEIERDFAQMLPGRSNPALERFLFKCLHIRKS